MKRLSLAIILACFTLTLAAQDAIRVNYQGAKPTIVDLAWAYVTSIHDDEEEGECQCSKEATGWVENALNNYRKGLPQEEWITLTVDKKNGYICCESRQDTYLARAEMCYWNEADGKHKLFAYSSWVLDNGKPVGGQFDGMTFYRYNNATKTMTMCETPGFVVEYLDAYALPRSGKDITVTKWLKNGKTQKYTLKWNGRKFVK